MKRRKGNISSFNVFQLIIGVGIILLFGAILYQFIEILELHNNLHQKSSEVESCLEQVDELVQEESVMKTDLDELKTKLRESSQRNFPIVGEKKKKIRHLDYDLRDILHLSHSLSDGEVMNEFKHKWQVNSHLYDTCGLVKSIPPPILYPQFNSDQPCKIAIISSWFPRPCGIATHSHMLFDGIRNICPINSIIDVIAVRNSNEDEVKFPDEVKQTFSKSTHEEYNRIANYINAHQYHAVIIGYEFGLYEDEYFLCLLKHIHNTQIQIIIILHTLADNLPYQKQALTQQTALLSHRIVVMTETMKRTIDELHRIPFSHVEVIPHGVPADPLSRPSPSSSSHHQILISNGLIHQGKGLEYTIAALPALLLTHPHVQYHILGTPHPTGTGTYEYYRSLKQQVVDLNLQNSVYFNESFFSNEDLFSILSTADVYINSYTDEVASVSGTLIMAMGLGLPCLSTPYPFAKEMFQDHRGGILVPFRNSQEITKGLRYLLTNKETAKELGRRGKEITMSWNEVGRRYLNLIYSNE